MANAVQVLGRIGVVATEAITGKRIVAADGSHTVKKGIGVAEYAADLGTPVTVITSGICEVTSGGIIGAGAPVMSDANGKAVALATDTIDPGAFIDVIGVAMEAATGADQDILVYVNHHVVEGTKAGS